MGRIVYLLFMAILAVKCSGEEHIKTETKKSKLMLEYNWPEPYKNLRRIPHPKSCHHFYHIKADGSHVKKRCHGDKIFDYRTLLCRKESLAKCWKNIVYKKDKTNIKKVKHNFSCPFPWGLYPNTEDCSLFYECLGGKIFTSKCPHSMLFDKVERTCVHSSKAACAVDSDISTTESNRQRSFEMRTDFNENPSPKKSSIATNINIKPTEKLAIHEDTSDERDKPEEQKSMTVENTNHNSKYATKFSLVLTTDIKSEPIKILHNSSEENNSKENNLENKSTLPNSNSESKLATVGISIDNKPHEKIVTEMKPSHSNETSSISVTSTENGHKTPTLSTDKITDLILTTSAIKSSGDINVGIKPVTVNATFKNASTISTENSKEDSSSEEKDIHSKRK